MIRAEVTLSEYQWDCLLALLGERVERLAADAAEVRPGIAELRAREDVEDAREVRAAIEEAVSAAVDQYRQDAEDEHRAQSLAEDPW